MVRIVILCSFFKRIEDTLNCFRDFLTFRWSISTICILNFPQWIENSILLEMIKFRLLSLIVRTFGLLSGVRQAVLYFGWLCQYIAARCLSLSLHWSARRDLDFHKATLLIIIGNCFVVVFYPHLHINYIALQKHLHINYIVTSKAFAYKLWFICKCFWSDYMI